MSKTANILIILLLITGLAGGAYWLETTDGTISRWAEQIFSPNDNIRFSDGTRYELKDYSIFLYGDSKKLGENTVSTSYGDTNLKIEFIPGDLNAAEEANRFISQAIPAQSQDDTVIYQESLFETTVYTVGYFESGEFKRYMAMQFEDGILRVDVIGESYTIEDLEFDLFTLEFK